MLFVNNFCFCLQGRTKKIVPVSRDCWMSLDSFNAIVDLVKLIDFAGAVNCRWKWDGNWRPVVKKFVDFIIPNQLELANMEAGCINPLARKKIVMFRSEYRGHRASHLPSVVFCYAL